MMNNSEQFSTYDISLATTLSVMGYICVTEQTAYSNRVLFIFDAMPGLKEVIGEYWANKLLINPKSYYSELKHLKSRIYAATRDENN